MSSSRGGYSLFIGRIPKNIRVRELEDIFSRHGPLTRCDVKYSGTGSAFAFVDYEDRRDAEDAVRKENGRELNNYNIVVEWAKKPTKPGYGDRDRGSGGGGGGRSYGDRGDYRGGDRGGRSYSDRNSDRERGGGSDRRRDDDDRTDRRRRRTRSPDDSPDKSSKRRRSDSPGRNGNGKDRDRTSKDKDRSDIASSKDREVDSIRATSRSPPAVDQEATTAEEKVTGLDTTNGNGDTSTAAAHHSRSASPIVEGSPRRDVEEDAEQSAAEEEKNGAEHSRSRSQSASRSPSP